MNFSIRTFVLSLFLALPVFTNAQVKVGDNPANTTPSAAFEIESTTKGMLPPRMTQMQMGAIVSPATGLVIYCTDCVPADLYLFDGIGFRSLAVGKATLEKGSLSCSRTLGGIYRQGKVTDATNTKGVSLGIAAGGAYTVGSDTVNGVYFLASGTNYLTGIANLTLQAYGTPEAAGTFTYTATANESQECTFNVTYTTQATFNCSSISNGLPTNLINATNYTGGGFSVTAPYTAGNNLAYATATVGPVSGLTLTRTSGTYAPAGGNVIYSLSGTYNGTTGGSINFVLPESGCTISAKTATYSSSTLNCTGTLSGVYQENKPLTSANTKVVSITVAATGGYNVTSNTLNGIVFKGTGAFTSTGSRTVVLKATGTPASSGTFSYTVSLGGQSCVFNVSVLPAANFKCGKATSTFDPDGALVAGTYYSGTYTLPYAAGNGEPYSLAILGTVNGMSFKRTPGTYNIGGGSMVYTATGTYTASSTPTIFTIPEGCVVSFPKRQVSTLAGSTFGYADGTGTAAKFKAPSRIATDEEGNLYISDDNRIRKITPLGVVTTFAGSGTPGSANGLGTAASFYYIQGLAFDKAGNLYVADGGNNKIRKITPGGLVSTLAGSGTSGYLDGLGTAAQFGSLYGLAIDKNDNIYVGASNCVRKITPAGQVTTVAGLGGTFGLVDDNGTNARFNFIIDVAIDKMGYLYIADLNNHAIRKMSPSGQVTTFAGGISGSANGIGATAQFGSAESLAVDNDGNILVCDVSGITSRIRKITPESIVSNLAGDMFGYEDGEYQDAKFGYTGGITVDKFGNIFIGDQTNSKVRKITP